MFDEMIERIQNNTIAMLLKVRIEVNRPQPAPVKTELVSESHAELTTNRSAEGGAKPAVKTAKTPGRNDPCPCGSGKKYKNCCGKNL